jgi:hypothetical protein
MAVFCHGALVVDAAVSGSTAETLLAILGQDGSPPHAIDCAADNEPVALSKFRGSNAGASQSLGEPAGLLPDDASSVTRLLFVTSSPGVRRALLQVFRI